MGCCLTSWFSKKQTALAISTTKAEYVSAKKACQQVLWMKQALVDYNIKLDYIPVLCDNKGAIYLSKNPVLHSRIKHIEIQHHFLRDNVQKGNISIEKVSSEDNIADILTKPLKREPFNLLRLGFIQMVPMEGSNWGPTFTSTSACVMKYEKSVELLDICGKKKKVGEYLLSCSRDVTLGRHVYVCGFLWTPERRCGLRPNLSPVAGTPDMLGLTLAFEDSHSMHFGRPEFALITSLPFGTVNFGLYTSSELKFRNRVFPHKLGLSVTNLHVIGVIEDEETFRKLCDQDSIRHCLLLSFKAMRLEQEKNIIEEQRFRVEEAKMMRLEEDKLLQIDELKKDGMSL
ncbi:hypothetical protein Tco_1273752 [Tanacetum coccineum]